MSEERQYAERPITHVVPVGDGFEHEMWGCTCMPDIHENAAVMGSSNLSEVGVNPGEPGELTFMHKKLGDTSRYEIFQEVTEWEDVDE
jgi:hypothetical protein